MRQRSQNSILKYDQTALIETSYDQGRTLMQSNPSQFTRRGFVARGARLILSGAAAITGGRNLLLAVELSVLDVAYAGSMGSIMEGPLKSAVAQSLKLDLHGRAQGSSALAQLIVSGSIRADLFMPITP